MTLLGTRPEIIRLSRIISRLDRLCDHVLVHTGQNYDPGLSDIFFEQLRVRQPDHFLGARGDGFGEQIAAIIAGAARVLEQERPDRLLVLGDTNSGLAAMVAKRLGVTVFHMEAGNRCYDDRVPEEVNRRIIDHSSDVLMPYTERSRANLLREGIESQRIYVTGNPIYEVLRYHDPAIGRSGVLGRLGLEPGRFFLVTMHRQENVDVEERLRSLLDALTRIGREYELPILCSLHPRTGSKLKRFGLLDETASPHLVLHPPFGFAEFVHLERNALCVLSDSGTVQEECCILGVANVTIRDATERPETIECGSGMLSGAEPEAILRCVRAVLGQKGDWRPPPEYLAPNVSRTVTQIVLGHYPARSAQHGARSTAREADKNGTSP
jgi:UDP-N-acetylglucosamine 2-epimerase (non-hydrolysing)